LLLDGTMHRLERAGGGWWHTEREIGHGDRYGYLLDDADIPLPDPRSRFQPDGVHGLSCGFDAGRFAWTDDGWGGRRLAGAVLYELHVGTFTERGTLDSATDRLDHLVDLGIDLVELMPVNAFDGPYNWGYDGVLWFAVDDSYGGPAAYQRFVDACHARGLGVVQDVVYNHLGPSGNYLPRFGPYLHAEHRSTWGPAVNLDEPAVRQLILDNAEMWLRDYHVDGLRLDAVHALVDTGPVHILSELAAATDRLAGELGRPLTLIAESDLNDPTVITARDEGGYGVHAQWSDDFHHAVHVAITGETDGYYADFADPAALPKVLTSGFYHDGTFSSFRGRAHGRPIDRSSTPTWRLVVADQNHDQVGNRAAGDRLSASVDRRRLAIAAVLTLTAPFTPMLFMGEEWGATTPWQFFASHPEPELARAVAEGRFEEFARMGWDREQVPDPLDPATFTRSKLDWSEPTESGHAWLLELYRSLIRLRREHADLTDPRFTATRVERHDRGQAVTIERGRVTIALNLGTERVELPLGGALLLATDPGVAVTGRSLSLPRLTAAIVRDERTSAEDADERTHV
jgi:maltooligosyltrehalose trehalohydrolase